ncbi:MAG: CRISPR-associated protein Cas4 [Bacteroidia bacterium]|jgi:CRISPR-associated exonuclease Cas4|nr:CRISPR-associated protein Cas4 [Bacteroidia bacterium]
MEWADLEALRITGTQVHYLQVCRRKLWFFSRFITMERGNAYVEQGRVLHQQAYGPKLRKERWLSGLVRLDYTEKGVIVEIKRSRRVPRGARAQLLFYLYALKRYVGWPAEEPFPITGEVRYPRERRKEEVVLTPETEQEVEGWIREIQQVTALPKPPEVPWKRICASCAYAELCWG